MSSMVIYWFILYLVVQVYGIYPDVRLSPGHHQELFKPYEGAIEVLVNGTWGSIGRHGVDNITAKTVCRLLGYGFTGFLINRVDFEVEPMLDSLSCVGNETSIRECTHRPYSLPGLPYYDSPGVHCFEQDFTELRLTGGEEPNSGQVLVKMDGRWGLLCGDHSWSGTLPHPAIDLVICRTLGYQRALNTVSSRFEFDIVISWLDIDNIHCTGNETHLNQCDRREGTIYQPRCYSYHGVNCITELGEFCISDDICTAVDNAVCINDICECRYGYSNNGTSTCTECDEGHYGKDCLQKCDCGLNNINFTMTNRSCDVITGSCTCDSNWTGSRCDIDPTITWKTPASSDTQLLIIIISSSTAGFMLLAAIITFCACKYRKRAIKESDSERKAAQNVSETGRCNHQEHTSASTSADAAEYNTIDDCTIGDDIDVDTDYDLHPDLLERSEHKNVSTEKRDGYDSDGYLDLRRTDRNDTKTDQEGTYASDGYLKPERTDRNDTKTDQEGRYASDGYLKPVHTNINTRYDYVRTRIVDKPLETDESGYLKMENGLRQLPEVPIVKQRELQHPYEGLISNREEEHDYSKMSVNK